MTRIRWNMKSKLFNKALGLPGPDVSYANAGTELDVDAKTLKAIEERYGPDAFEVVSGGDAGSKKSDDDKKRGGKPRKSAKSAG